MSVSDDPWESRIKAIVEAVERYCHASGHDPSDVLRAPYRGVAEWAVPPRRFALHSAQQYRSIAHLRLPGDDEAIDWSWAYSLTAGRFVLVPAALAYASVSRRRPNNFADSVVSTGVACHVSLEAAILAGLLEVVERDAVMVAWLNRREPPLIAVKPGDEVHELIETHFNVPDIEFVLLDLTADTGIPVVGCLALSNDPRFPAATMGAAARTNPAEAARKALFEAAQMLYVGYGFGWTRDESFVEADVRSLADHAHFYAGRQGASQLRFFASSPEITPLEHLPDPEADGSGGLSACVDALAAVGLETLVIDLTTDDVARCGFHAVRVMVPGAVDLSGDVRSPRLGSPRINSVPLSMGWAALPYDELNIGAGPLA